MLHAVAAPDVTLNQDDGFEFSATTPHRSTEPRQFHDALARLKGISNGSQLLVLHLQKSRARRCDERVTRYCVSRLGYLTLRLDQVTEGERTTLDNSGLMLISNMWPGSQHGSSKATVFPAGEPRGVLETANTIDYTD